MASTLRSSLLLISAALLLAGCEQLGIPDPAKTAAAKEAEGKAVGSACRHAGRALEDCYRLNPKAVKAAVFTGWKEMNDYMTEKQIEVVPPTLPAELPPGKKKEKGDKGGDGGKGDGADAAHDDKQDDAPPAAKGKNGAHH